MVVNITLKMTVIFIKKVIAEQRMLDKMYQMSKGNVIYKIYFMYVSEYNVWFWFITLKSY